MKNVLVAELPDPARISIPRGETSLAYARLLPALREALSAWGAHGRLCGVWDRQAFADAVGRGESLLGDARLRFHSWAPPEVASGLTDPEILAQWFEHLGACWENASGATAVVVMFPDEADCNGSYFRHFVFGAVEDDEERLAGRDAGEIAPKDLVASVALWLGIRGIGTGVSFLGRIGIGVGMTEEFPIPENTEESLVLERLQGLGYL